MDTYRPNIERLAAWVARPAVIASALMAVLLLGAASGAWTRAITGGGPLDLVRSQMAFTPTRFVAAVADWDIAQFVRMTLSIDLVFPLAYAAAIAGVWMRAAGASASTRLVVALPSLAVVADWSENVLHSAAANSVADGNWPSVTLVLTGSLFAAIKWIAIVAGVGRAGLAAWRRGGVAWLVAGVGLGSLATIIAATVLVAVD